MYNWFYGFSEDPFQSNPDPKFIFLTDSHREVLNSIQLGIVEKKGVVLVTGEAGIGKTILARQLLQTLNPTIKSIIIYRPPALLEELMEQILLSLGVSVTERSRELMLQQIRLYIHRQLKQGETLAVMIDEAHVLLPGVLKELAHMASPHAKRPDLFSLVLLGRPEVEHMLSKEDLQETRQKIWIRRRLQPFLEQEAKNYIDHRLTLAGSSTGKIFTPQAVYMICRYGKGNPRSLNVLCDNSLLVGYGLTKKPVDMAIVKEVLEDLDLLVMDTRRELKPPPPPPPQTTEEEPETGPSILRPSLYAVLLLVCLGGAIFMWGPYLKQIPRILTDQWAQAPALVEQEPSPPGREERADLAGRRTVKIEPERKGEIPPLSPKPEAPRSEVKGEPPAPPEPTKVSPAPVPPKPSKPAAALRISVPRQARGQEEKVARVQRGDSIYTLCQKVYGVANTTLVDYILETNSQISNPDFLQVNQKIVFPAITESVLVIESSPGVFRVHLGTFLKPEYTTYLNEEPSLKEKEIKMVPRPVSSGKTWYRAMVGTFKTREEGLELVRVLRSKGLLPAFEEFRSHG